MKKISFPNPSEYAVYYQKYLDEISSETHVMKALKESAKKIDSVLRNLSEENLLFKYAPGKWSIKDILQHLVDTEKVFLYRAMRFSRNDKTPLPFFDEDAFAEQAHADKIPIKKLLKEFKAQRALTLAFFDNQSASFLKRTGMASQASMSVRACAWIILAHENHHWTVIENKYLKQES